MDHLYNLVPEASEVLDLVVDVAESSQYLVRAVPSITELLDLTGLELWWLVEPHLPAHIKGDVGVLVGSLGCILLMAALDVLGGQLVAYLYLLQQRPGI